jgi:hypothetical protein
MEQEDDFLNASLVLKELETKLSNLNISNLAQVCIKHNSFKTIINRIHLIRIFPETIKSTQGN